MGTRQWVKDLAKWIKRSGSSTGAVAKRSRHKTAHVLDLFADENPNPSLRLYLDLANVAGARLQGVDESTPAGVVAHLAALARDNQITLSALARASGVSRPLLSTLFNDPDPNPSLATIDRIVTALDAGPGFALVSAEGADADEADDETEANDQADEEADEEADDEEADAEEDDAEEDDAEEDDADEDDADEDEADEDEADEDEADEDEADKDEADDDRADANLAQVKALQAQNTDLLRQVEAKTEGTWGKVARAFTAGAVVGAGIAAFMLKPPPKGPPKN